MSFYRQDDCENWKWSKISKPLPSNPVKGTDILGGVYTLESNKLEKKTAKDVIHQRRSPDM